jgi:hypothetical protein
MQRRRRRSLLADFDDERRHREPWRIVVSVEEVEREVEEWKKGGNWAELARRAIENEQGSLIVSGARVFDVENCTDLLKIFCSAA